MSQPANFSIPTSAEAPVAPTTMFPRIEGSLQALLSSHSGSTRPSYAVVGTVWQDSDNGQLYLYDGTNDLPIAVQVAVPATAASPGIVGQYAVETGFVYHCVATDTWERTAIATW